MNEYDGNVKGRKRGKGHKKLNGVKYVVSLKKWGERKKKRNPVRGQLDRLATVAKSNRSGRHFSAFSPLHLPILKKIQNRQTNKRKDTKYRRKQMQTAKDTVQKK